MATWGGSTVDNLGSITEDEDGNDPEAGQEDDDGEISLLTPLTVN